MKRIGLLLIIALVYCSANAQSVRYKGILDVGYTIGTGDFGLDRVGASTSHGIQCGKHFFIGAGAGVKYFTDAEVVGVPIFAHLRSNLLNSNITPYLDLKAGYSVADVEGFYLAPAVGCRFGFNDRLALNLSVGYELQKAEYEFYGWGWDYSSTENCGGVSIKLGLEF